MLGAWLALAAGQSFAQRLSQDLISVVSHSPDSGNGSSSALIDRITQVAGEIDSAAAAILNSTGQKPTPEQRATVSCKIESLVLPGSVFTSNSPEYQDDETLNWLVSAPRRDSALSSNPCLFDCKSEG